MTSPIKHIQELRCSDLRSVPSEVLESTEPLLLKGLVSHWPSVMAAEACIESSVSYLRSFSCEHPLTVYQGKPEINGRIFYNDDFTEFNFQRLKMPLEQVLDALQTECIAKPSAETPSYYVGSTMIDHWLPGFRVENDLGLGELSPLVSLWLGNQSKIAAHYDFPNNIACNIAGRRRFTLFPPEQADNLYVGPLDFTPSGQAISLVDTTNPDFASFPKYRTALEASLAVELEPGDAIFIPSMWWHHVQSLEDFNALVNYWWRVTPAYLGAPANALQHAIMSMHGLPQEQKRAWKDLFERYVFNQDEENFKHIPDHAKGVLSDVDEEMARAIKARLVHFLK